MVEREDPGIEPRPSDPKEILATILHNEELLAKSIKTEQGSTKPTSTSMFSSPYKSIAFSSESPTVPNSSGVKTVVATYSGENITSTLLDRSRNCSRVWVS